MLLDAGLKLGRDEVGEMLLDAEFRAEEVGKLLLGAEFTIERAEEVIEILLDAKF